MPGLTRKPRTDHLKATQWVKGKSGNPAGGPKGLAEFRQACREMTPEALAKLAQALRMKRVTSNGIKAAETILGYGWGRPAIQLEISGEISVSIAERLEAARKRVLELQARPINGEAVEP